jgi:hypothetical protein
MVKGQVSMNRKTHNNLPSTDDESYRPLPEDCFLDLKRLSQRTSISVSTLREHIKDPSNALPAYLVKGKILVNWIEFKKWIQAFRHKNVEIDRIVNEVMESLRRKLRQSLRLNNHRK